MGSAVLATMPSARATSRRRSYASAIWLAFVLMQALDGVLSYLGVTAHGLWLEGNPIVAWYAHQFGPAAAFAGAKLFAVTCGTVLYLTGRHSWLAALALLHLVVAVVPWMYLLSRSA